MYTCKGVASLVLEDYDNGCVGECSVVVRQVQWVVCGVQWSNVWGRRDSQVMSQRDTLVVLLLSNTDPPAPTCVLCGCCQQVSQWQWEEVNLQVLLLPTTMVTTACSWKIPLRVVIETLGPYPPNLYGPLVQPNSVPLCREDEIQFDWGL